MDDSRKGNRNRAIALVVRHFSPSRIERQLLAQVFELVCHDRQSLTNSSIVRQAEQLSIAQSDRNLSIEPQLAGRATS